MRIALPLLASVAAAIATPAPAKPVGFALIDIEGADAERLNRIGANGAAAFVVNTVLDATPDQKEARFVTPPPKGVIPKRGAPASVYIVHYASDGLGVNGSLEYLDYARKTPSAPAPAGPGYREDRKTIRAQLIENRQTMFIYGALTRNRSHGSRFLVAVFQPDGPVKVADLAKADALFGTSRLQ